MNMKIFLKQQLKSSLQLITIIYVDCKGLTNQLIVQM